MTIPPSIARSAKRAPVIGPVVEGMLADERVEAAIEAEEAAIDSVAASEGREGVDAIIAGAAPDDAARLREHLGLPKPPGTPRKTSDELADDWRAAGFKVWGMVRPSYAPLHDGTWEPGETAPKALISTPLRPLCWRLGALRWLSTATGRLPPNPAPPIAWRPWGLTSSRSQSAVPSF